MMQRALTPILQRALTPIRVAIWVVGVVVPFAVAEAQWVPSAQAPDGTLSHALEGQRHDLFIEIAERGDIDLVFFGTTEAEMWWWPDRGRAVWDRAFGSLRAANFGSQGTRPESLLWRMQNGELDGYRAKLIVLQAGLPGSGEDLAADYGPLLDEVRARQPDAAILLFAPLPRGQVLAAWQQRAAANAAAFSQFVDEQTVFYIDIGELFYRDDGTFRRETWSLDFDNRGTQAEAFEIWAGALEPWIERFVL